MTFGKRNLGMVLRNLYPRSFATWQDTVFRVTSKSGTIPGIVPDQKEIKKLNRILDKGGLMRKAYEKIREELLAIDQSFEIDEWKEDEDGDPITELNIIIPEKVELRLDESLEVVYCDRCGHLEFLSKAPRTSGGSMPFHLKCRKGGGKYRQAPIFVPFSNSGKTLSESRSADIIKIKPMVSKQVYCYYLRENGKCIHPDNHPSRGGDGKCVSDLSERHAYLQFNPDRPLGGLRVVNNMCPKGFKNIPSQQLITHRAGVGFHYRKRFPNKGVTSPLFTTVAWENEKHGDEINSINNFISEQKNIWFNSKFVDMKNTKFSKIDVLEIVYGIRIGGFYDHWMRGTDQNDVLGRILRTQGFVITIKGAIYDKINEVQEKYYVKDGIDRETYLLNHIIHTLKHAILYWVPSFTGFQSSQFHGSYEILDHKEGAKVYLFDNDDGGHGGFATLIQQKESFGNMIGKVYSSLRCPVRNCQLACAHCLYLRRCGNGNKELNRNMLLESEIILRQV